MEKYYGGTAAGLHAAFGDVAEAGCSFIVAGRADEASGAFQVSKMPSRPRSWANFSPFHM
jgi:hypothetical protein